MTEFATDVVKGNIMHDIGEGVFFITLVQTQTCESLLACAWAAD